MILKRVLGLLGTVGVVFSGAASAQSISGTVTESIGSLSIEGVTVAALAIPQGLAYALVAGVPPEMGLLAAAAPAVIAALFGSSPYLVTGPTNPIALVIGAWLLTAEAARWLRRQG